MWFLLRHHLLMHQHPKLRNEWTEKSSDTSKYVTEFEEALPLCPPSWMVPLVICLWRDAAPCFPHFLPTRYACAFIYYSERATLRQSAFHPEGNEECEPSTASQPAGRGVPGHAILWREQITPRHCRFERADSVPQMKSAMKIRRQRIRTTFLLPCPCFSWRLLLLPLSQLSTVGPFRISLRNVSGSTALRTRSCCSLSVQSVSE